MQARLVATLALSQDKTLLEMARDMRDMSEWLKRDMRPTCQFCDAGEFCWWHATPEQRKAQGRKS